MIHLCFCSSSILFPWVPSQPGCFFGCTSTKQLLGGFLVVLSLCVIVFNLPLSQFPITTFFFYLLMAFRFRFGIPFVNVKENHRQ